MRIPFSGRPPASKAATPIGARAAGTFNPGRHAEDSGVNEEGGLDAASPQVTARLTVIFKFGGFSS